MQFTGTLLNSIGLIDILKLCKDYDPDNVKYIQEFYRRNARRSKAVLNGVLLLSIQNKKGYTPNHVYLTKVLNTWINKGRLTAIKASNYLNAVAEWKNTGSVNKPDWLDEYLNELPG